MKPTLMAFLLTFITYLFKVFVSSPYQRKSRLNQSICEHSFCSEKNRPHEIGNTNEMFCFLCVFWGSFLCWCLAVECHWSADRDFASSVNAARRRGSDWAACWPGGNLFCLAGCQRAWKVDGTTKAFYHLKKRALPLAHLLLYSSGCLCAGGGTDKDI